MDEIQSNINKNINILLCSKILIALLSILNIFPYIYFNENMSLNPNDFLDSIYAHSQLIIKYQKEILSFKSFKIDDFLGKSSLTSLWGGYSIHFLWLFIGGSWWGYVISKVIAILVGFVGFFLFSRCFLLKQLNINYILWLSFFYSVTPFWGYDLSVAGIPLVFYIYYSLKESNNVKLIITYYIVLLLFTFYSSLILSGIFIIATLFIIESHEIIKQKKYNWKSFVAFIVLGVGYFLSHIRLFEEYIFNPILTNRHEFQYTYYGLGTSINKTIKAFSYGIFTASDQHLWICLIVFFVLIIAYSYNILDKLYIYILFYLIISSSIYGFMYWNKLKFVHEFSVKYIPIDLTRFVFLNSFFWICLLGKSIEFIQKNLNKGQSISIVIIVIQLCFLIDSHEVFRMNYYNYNIKEFYSEELFKKIKQDIDLSPKMYKVICLGFPPGVAIYNGLSTLDGYSSSFSLQHKRDFFKIIKNELEKDTSLKSITNGNKCIALSAEIGLNNLEINSASNIEIQHLDYDFKQLKRMNCKFLISTARINLFTNSKIELVNIYHSKKSYWKFYLYKFE